MNLEDWKTGGMAGGRKGGLGNWRISEGEGVLLDFKNLDGLWQGKCFGAKIQLCRGTFDHIQERFGGIIPSFLSTWKESQCPHLPSRWTLERSDPRVGRMILMPVPFVVTEQMPKSQSSLGFFFCPDYSVPLTSGCKITSWCSSSHTVVGSLLPKVSEPRSKRI